MRVPSITALVLTGSLVGLSSAQIEFKPFASSAGRYKVVFPGPVKSDTYDVTSADKTPLKLYVDSVELRGGTSFAVTYIDVTEATARQPTGQWLDKVRDGNKGPDGKLVEEKDVTVGIEKYPGRDILIEKPDGFVRNRAVIAGRRLYQVLVRGPKEVVTSPSADRFLESFEITR